MISPAQTCASHAVQEIRQLNMKQEGFVREISDLQETVEWKDKKIGVRPSSHRGGGVVFHSSVSLVHETDFSSSYFARLK